MSERQASLAQADLSLAGSTKTPDWSLIVSYGQRSPAFSNMVSVLVAIDLPIAAERRQDRDIAAKRALVERARNTAEDMRRAAEAEARGFVADWETAAARVARYEPDDPAARARTRRARTRRLSRRPRHVDRRARSAPRRGRGADEPRAGARRAGASLVCDQLPAARGGQVVSRVLCAALAIAVLGLVAAGGYWFGSSRSHTPSPGSPAAAPQPDRKVLYWYDPMFPQQKFDKPGKSPFMDMQLVPKYADEGGDDGTVSISPRVVQNLGVRTAEAQAGIARSQARPRSATSTATSAPSSLVQPRDQRLRRAAARARAARPGARRAQPLVEILFPEWAGAQDEYLALRRLAGPDVEPLAARRARAAACCSA